MLVLRLTFKWFQWRFIRWFKLRIRLGNRRLVARSGASWVKKWRVSAVAIASASCMSVFWTNIQIKISTISLQHLPIFVHNHLLEPLLLLSPKYARSQLWPNVTGRTLHRRAPAKQSAKFVMASGYEQVNVKSIVSFIKTCNLVLQYTKITSIAVPQSYGNFVALW